MPTTLTAPARAVTSLYGAVCEARATLIDSDASFTLDPAHPAPHLPYQEQTRERITAALASSGFHWPGAVTVKPGFAMAVGSPPGDLALACAALAAAGAIRPGALADLVLLGELRPDGSLRPDHGPAVHNAVNGAFRDGYYKAVVPEENGPDAWQQLGVAIHGARHLRQVVALLNSEPRPEA